MKTAEFDGKKVFAFIWHGRKTFVMYEPCSSSHHPQAKFQVQLLHEDGHVWQVWYELSEPTVESIQAELLLLLQSRKHK